MLLRIANLLKLGRDETRHALLLGGILFFMTGSYTLVKTARDALFLAVLPAALLPYVFLGVGALTTLVAVAYARASRRRPTWRSLEDATWAAAISLGLFAYLYGLHARWVPIVFYLWVNAYGLIQLAQFWSFANSVSNPREAKRIFGAIGTGGILGGLFGGALAAPLVTSLGLRSLLVIGGVLAGLAAPMVRLAVERGALPPPEQVREDPEGPIHPLSQPYVRWLTLAALCSVLVTTLLDYQFKAEIQRRDPSPHGLASFLGWFYTATNLAALIMQLFFTRWSLHALGAGWSAAVLPAGLGIGAAATLIAPGFGAVITTRLWDQVMRLSINRTAGELFFFPLKPEIRRRAKALIEAGLERVGDGLAGLLILAAGLAMGSSTWTIAAMVASLVVVWVMAWLRVRRLYVSELGENVRRMNLDPHRAPVSLREASILEEFSRLLASPYERLVLHGLEMIEESAPERIEEHIVPLMSHPSPRVRARALSLAGARQMREASGAIEALIGDPDPEVRIEAMRARVALGGADPIGALEEFLDSDDVNLRRGAVNAIAEFAPPADEGRVRAILERLLRGGSEERLIVAESLGRRRSGTLHDLIPPLLSDPSLEVRNAALLSAGLTNRRELIPAMVDALAGRESQATARRALAAFGDRVVGTLGDYLSDPAVPIQSRREIPRALGQIGTAEAVAALFRCRDRDDVRLAYRILKAENRIREHDARIRFPARLVDEDLDFDVQSYLFAFVHYRFCPIGGPRSAERLLCVALNERMDQALSRVFRRLALLYPPQEIFAAYRGVLSENPRGRGNSLEYLENALSPEHARRVLPLVDDSGDEKRLRFAQARYGLRYRGPSESLAEILQGKDAWLRTCALYVVGARRDRALQPLVEQSLGARDAGVRETAAWAFAALAGA